MGGNRHEGLGSYFALGGTIEDVFDCIGFAVRDREAALVSLVGD